MDGRPLAEVLADAAVSGTADVRVLPGLACWAVEVADGAPDAVVLVAGVDPVPVGALTVAGSVGALVAAAMPALAVAVVAEPGTDRVRWAAGREAVAAVAARVDLPPGARGVLEQALDRAPVAGGEAPGPVLAGMAAGVAAQRRAIAVRIHDGPVQELTAAQLLLDSALWGADVPDELRTQLERGLEALRSAITSCRHLMADLSDRAHPGAGA